MLLFLYFYKQIYKYSVIIFWRLKLKMNVLILRFSFNNFINKYLNNHLNIEYLLRLKLHVPYYVSDRV